MGFCCICTAQHLKRCCYTFSIFSVWLFDWILTPTMLDTMRRRRNWAQTSWILVYIVVSTGLNMNKIHVVKVNATGNQWQFHLFLKQTYYLVLEDFENSPYDLCAFWSLTTGLFYFIAWKREARIFIFYVAWKKFWVESCMIFQSHSFTLFLTILDNEKSSK